MLHFYREKGWQVNTLIKSPVRTNILVAIGTTVETHNSCINMLLAAHSLSGCDTVGQCFGIGKKVTVKVLQTNKYNIDKYK